MSHAIAKKITLIAAAAILLLRLVTLFMPVPAYAKIYSNLASGFEDSEKTDLAIHYYRKAIYHDPTYPRPYLKLGIIYSAKGDEGKKQEYFGKVVQLSPIPMEREYARAYRAIGMQYFKKKDYVNAIKNLEKAHIFDRDLFDVYYYLGASYYNIGNKESALQQEKILYALMQSSTVRGSGGQSWRRKLADLLGLEID